MTSFMLTKLRRGRTVAVALTAAVLALAAVHSGAQDVHVMVSGGLTAAYKLLVPQFEKSSGGHVETVFGPSMGTTQGAIPLRLARGEPADVVIMVRSALDDLVSKGAVIAGSQVDLARSRIGMAVRAGSPVPDISSVEAFRHVLLQARSVAYSDSASGVYIANEMFKRLGIDKEMSPKSRQIPATPVGEIVARGEAEIGFQQLSELLPVAGITVAGPIPNAVQQITIFSAGIVARSAAKDAGLALIKYLASPEACGVIQKSAMEPVACARTSAASQDPPNPYVEAKNWAKLPEGRIWGHVFGVTIDSKGNVWVIDRCGETSCLDSKLPPIMEFDASGKFLKSMGEGLFAFPHSILTAPLLGRRVASLLWLRRREPWRLIATLGFCLLFACCARTPTPKGNPDQPPTISGNVELGKALFDYTCDACHYPDSRVRAGPGLGGLYRRKTLPNGVPVTDANIERFIRDGSNLMPGYHDRLTADEMRDLIAYLRSLSS
jgi:molybdate transport system substrate-binding protein